MVIQLRLFSAASLQSSLRTTLNGRTFTAVYLVVFWELIDAYQNRSITHSGRVIMVLRAYFFLERWRTFIDVAGYDRFRYFLSPQCADILRMIIQGYLSLLIVYRDYLPGNNMPLLPWALSSEP
ncbi:hypothetical protein GGX14DRAFT_374116 [Mycena pura]|uniref:Uncharacterized protein n=1 Tax=Mycena pura TaxID=153505 RepID=A0AAD6V3A6_9AGAR|nr:hypothetical protein GGX14DRAFT_374116 [Mycena pura]